MGYIKKFDYIADGGGLEVAGRDMAFTIPNGYGDGDGVAYIVTREQHEAAEQPAPAAPTWHFFTSFTVIDDSSEAAGAYVGNVNPFICVDDAIPAGRYGAFFKDGVIHLVIWD